MPCLLFLLGLSVLFAACQHGGGKAPLHLRCPNRMAKVLLDSAYRIDERAFYFFQDTYAVAGWNLMEESIYDLYHRGCFANALDADSILVSLRHSQTEIVLRYSPTLLRTMSAARVARPNFYNFIDHQLPRDSFRRTLISLEHFYGKAISPDPKEGLIYAEDVIGFLRDKHDDLSHPRAGDKSQKLLDTLLAHSFDPGLSDDLSRFRRSD
jgi:hypothetical protein